MQTAQNIRISRDEKRWEVEIRAEITPETLGKHRGHALKEIGKTAQIAGFRAGHIPEATLVRHFGEEAIMREAAEMAIQHELPHILASEKLNIVEAPRVSIEPPTQGSPLPFTARAPLAPVVELPDYTALAARKNAGKQAVAVSDDEHQETLTHLRRERARVGKIEAGTDPEKAAEEARVIEEKDLPELDDEFVKSLGYEDASTFSTKVREHLTNEKEMQAASAHRAELLDMLVEKSTVHFPALLTEYELDDMESRFAGDLERMGKTLDAYLTETKKTRDSIREEWKEAAEKRAKIRLILSEIARKEHIEPDEAVLARELERARKQLPQAAPEALRAHITHALRNEKVLEWLETRTA